MFPSDLVSDLQDILDRGRKWLEYFDAGKTQLVFLTCQVIGAIDVKINGSVL